MESILSERFKLGANIGRPHHSGGPPNPVESFDSRDDVSDNRGGGDNMMMKKKNNTGDNASRKPVLMLPVKQTIDGEYGVSKYHDQTKKHNHTHHHDISRTISQDTAETATMSVSSDITSATGLTNGTDATLDAAVAASSQKGTGVLELSTIEENSNNEQSGRDNSVNQTPGAKSNVATNTGTREANNEAEQMMRKTFPDFISSMPKTWSGSSLSFIKFLLFVKESDESFIPEMDRMLADYDLLVNSLQSENKDLKNKLKSEIGALKKRVHDKKKLVAKLTKKLTECQGYITELTDELERIYREKGVGRGQELLSSLRDEITVATATSEITMEQSICVGGANGANNHSIEATLSRMLAEERSKADTLADLNKSLNDDLNDTKKEVDELERKLEQSEKGRVGLERTVEGHWTKVEILIEENRTLQEDLAGVVMELSDAQEEFQEREAQLIQMIEQGGGGYDDDGEDMNMDIEGDHTVHDLEANIVILQEELSVSKRVLEAIKDREKESTRRAGELLVHNETLLARNEALEGMHKKEMDGMRKELDKAREENANVCKISEENNSMVNFAREIIASKGGDFATAGGSNIDKDRRIAELEQQLSAVQQEQKHHSDVAAKCLRDTLVYLYDCAAGSTDQDPSSLIKTVRETSKMFMQATSSSNASRAFVPKNST